jgi:hypothetical protein
MARPRTTARVLPLTDPPAVPGAVLGKVIGVEAAMLIVEVPGRGVHRARLAIALTAAQARAAAKDGAEAVLVFTEGAPAQPVVLGLIQTSLADPPATEAQVDGKRVVIEGKQEVVLKCGAASLTLRANGKVVIRGAYVESHASGTNRIKGGSVQIN